MKLDSLKTKKNQSLVVMIVEIFNKKIRKKPEIKLNNNKKYIFKNNIKNNKT